MTTIYVSSGVTSNGLTVAAGNTLAVLAGGYASNTILLSGATEVISSGGTSYGTTVSSGAVLEFLGGATSYYTHFSGGTQIVASGYQSTNAPIAGGGRQTMIVSAGGSTVGDVVTSGGAQIVSSGGTDSATVISSGGSETVYAGGIASGAVVSSGGKLLVSGGVVSGGTVSAGGSEAVLSGGVASAVTVAAGGVLLVSSGGTETNAVVSGGTLEVAAGGITSGAIYFSNGTIDTLQIDGTTIPTTVISGAGTGDTIILEGVAYNITATETVAANSVTITTGGSTYKLNVAGASSDGPTLVNDGGVLAVVFATCFLRGTAIATPDGERAVETLRAGDSVLTVVDGETVSQPVRWVGGRAVRAEDFADQRNAHPVRIRRHAFGENVPHRDLLVTQEHCVFVSGRLIPVRLLVNGRSILVDRTVAEYEFFHVELDRHGILLSEGLATESYLDTGNRAVFGAGSDARADAGETAAPIAVDRATVQPVWQRLATRADALFPTGAADGDAFVLSDDPCLRMLLEDGRELAPRWHEGMRFMFHLPRGAKVMRLLSRAGIPAEVYGAYHDDRRQLGVAVQQLVIWNGLEAEPVDFAGSTGSDGWHAPDGQSRWTDGDAALLLPEALDQDTVVDLTLAATLRYRLAA